MAKITLFFTYGVSLKTWDEFGFLSREITYYHDLSKKGIKVQFLTYGDATDYNISGVPKNIEIVPIYTKATRPKNKILMILQSFLIPFIFRHELSSSDIFKSNQIWGSWVAVIAKFLFSRPLFIRVGYDLYKNSLIDEKNKFKLLFIFLISKLAYKSADHILLPTNEISDFAIKKYNLKLEKISIYPNWIDTNLFRKFKVSEIYTNRVLFIGRLSKEKNIPLLINSLSKTKIALDIIGDGDLKKYLQSHIKSLSIDAKFLGRVPNSELPKIINKYPIYVLCSIYEGNPKTLLEAMSCERAVIGTNQPGINNIINHNLNGALCDSSVTSLRESIIALIHDKNKRLKMGRAARRFIVNRNSMTSLIKLEMLIYNQFKNTHKFNFKETSK